MTENVNRKRESVMTTDLEWKPVSLRKDNRDQKIRKILDAQPLFANLSSRDWRELSALFHKRTYNDDEVIFDAGTPGLGMYVVTDGNVAIYEDFSDKSPPLTVLGQGDFFGEMSLIDEVDRSATAVACGVTQLIGIFRPQLQDLMHRRPKLGLTILERLAKIIVTRLREANIRIAEINAKTYKEDE